MAAGRLKIDIRRKRILELLAQNGQVTVAELSGLLNATQTTIRTDLDTMAAENRLVRIPGGAIAIPAQPVQTPVQEAAPDALAAQKRAIAAKVLSHIQDGDTLFLNSGSTTLRVAEALCARKRLCVVTNSIRAAEVLAGYPETHVVLLGGEINAIYGFTFGDDAVQQLGRYQPACALRPGGHRGRRYRAAVAHALGPYYRSGVCDGEISLPGALRRAERPGADRDAQCEPA